MEDTMRKKTEYELFQFMDFILEFSRESDRAAVVLAAAKLDLTLRELLENALLPCTTRSDDLFDGMGPLNSFSAKIDLAFRLGLIDSGLAHSIHTVRKLRNDFAHEPGTSRLNTPPHSDRVAHFLSSFEKLNAYHSFPRELPKSLNKKLTDIGLSFRVAIAVILRELENLKVRLPRIAFFCPATLDELPCERKELSEPAGRASQNPDKRKKKPRPENGGSRA
jgi:hypothetical protein